MTAFRRIFATGRPSLVGAPVLPMDPADARFWSLRKQRPASMREWLENRR